MQMNSLPSLLTERLKPSRPIDCPNFHQKCERVAQIWATLFCML